MTNIMVLFNIRVLSVFVCFLPVTLLSGKDCGRHFAMKAFEQGNGFDALDRGRFVVVHPCSTLSRTKC